MRVSAAFKTLHTKLQTFSGSAYKRLKAGSNEATFTPASPKHVVTRFSEKFTSTRTWGHFGLPAFKTLVYVCRCALFYDFFRL